VTFPHNIDQLIEGCNSDDAIERFDAFEELWDKALHQGTPCADSPAIFKLLLDWIEDRHPDWIDILDGVYNSALDLSGGPTRTGAENVLRVATLGSILRTPNLFEKILDAPCYTDEGLCKPHRAGAELLRLASPARADWLATRCLRLVREDPVAHGDLLVTLDRLGAFEDFSSNDLYFCAQQTEVEKLKRAALFHMASRGDERGIRVLVEIVERFDEDFIPSTEEAALLSRKPANLPFNLLTGLFRRASDLRAVHDLACATLRKAANDDREGWTLIEEKRSELGLMIRHPGVPSMSSTSPTEEAIFYRDDLLRNPRLHLVDTDMWALLGLPQP
jgi:hypothetical protein